MQPGKLRRRNYRLQLSNILHKRMVM